MSATLATPSLLEIKIFQYKGYDVIIIDYDVTYKTRLYGSNHIVDEVMLPKFGNSSISIKEVIIMSILQGFDQKNYFFCGVVLVEVQWFGNGTRYDLEILHQCGKSIETKIQKVLWGTSYVCRSYRRKTVWHALTHSDIAHINDGLWSPLTAVFPG